MEDNNKKNKSIQENSLNDNNSIEISLSESAQSNPSLNYVYVPPPKNLFEQPIINSNNDINNTEKENKQESVILTQEINEQYIPIEYSSQSQSIYLDNNSSQEIDEDEIKSQNELAEEQQNKYGENPPLGQYIEEIDVLNGDSPKLTLYNEPSNNLNFNNNNINEIKTNSDKNKISKENESNSSKNEQTINSSDIFPKSEDEALNELQFFLLLYSNEILDMLVEEANNYYKKILIDKYGIDYKKVILAKKGFNTYPYLYVTKGISKEDILAFLGIRIYMGIHKYPVIDYYWNNSNIYKNIIRSIMPKTYYFLLAKALHFPEKEEKNESESSSEYENSDTNINNGLDPRKKINLYLEKLSENFQKYYELGKNITIDESLVHFTGRNSMKFYIPMKPHKWGFKIHLLCDSDSHYLYNMLFDPGKVGKDLLTMDDTYSLTESIVLKLLECIKDADKKQRNLFFDGWYSSLRLMKKLTKMGYLNTTVLRANSKELPSKIKLEGYDKAYNDEILIQKYEGKKTILFATNYKIDKEELRNIYNIKNRGVDTFDQYLEISSIQRRTKKWYKKILFFGVDAAIINSKILCEKKTGKSYTTVKFKEKLVEHIFRMYNIYNNKNNNNNQINNNKSENNEIPCVFSFRLHNMGHVKNIKRTCKKCHKKTPYICIECNIPLHPECFTDFHNRYIYK